MTESHTRVPAHDSALARAVAAFCTRERNVETPLDAVSHPRWRALHETGSALWLDSGDLDANRGVWTPEFSGLTTNNTLLNKEVQQGRLDDLAVAAAEMLRRTGLALSADATRLEIAFVLNAVHALALVAAFDADVSVELHTDLAWDAGASFEYGRRYHDLCPQRFVVKVPLTPEGLLAARRLEEVGVRVNCTLGFSPRQNLLVARFARPHFVNVFLGRINTLFEESGIGAAAAAAGIDIEPGVAAAIRSQQMLREMARAEMLTHTRQIAASMRSGDQVAALAGVDVLTMPVAVAAEFAAAGIEPDRIENRTGGEVCPQEAIDALPTETRARVFFAIDDTEVAAAEQLASRDPETLDGERVRSILTDAHLDELFPRLEPADRQRIAAGGKIPDAATWAARVADRTASWDGLLTEAALASFATDQAALDERVRELIR